MKIQRKYFCNKIFSDQTPLSRYSGTSTPAHPKLRGWGGGRNYGDIIRDMKILDISWARLRLLNTLLKRLPLYEAPFEFDL